MDTHIQFSNINFFYFTPLRRGETIDYTEPNLSVNRCKPYFKLFSSLSKNLLYRQLL